MLSKTKWTYFGLRKAFVKYYAISSGSNPQVLALRETGEDLTFYSLMLLAKAFYFYTCVFACVYKSERLCMLHVYDVAEV